MTLLLNRGRPHIPYSNRTLSIVPLAFRICLLNGPAFNLDIRIVVGS